jgi:predicted Co/Zn/Cd cation transporter (cation efflux family)
MRQRMLTAINGAIALVVVLLMVQMWLLTAALESFLAGHHETAVPAALISGLLFLACLGLYLLVDRLDREARRD